MGGDVARRRTVLQLVERLSFGGAQHVMERLAVQLKETRYAPVVGCLETGPLQAVLEGEGLTVETVGLTRRSVLTGPLYVSYLVRVVRGLSEIVRRRGVEVIHAHLPDAILVAALAGRACRVPVVATYHGLRIVPERSALDPRNALKMALYRGSARWVSKTIAVSPEVLTMLRRDLRFAESATTLVVNGIETERFAGASVPAGLRAELGLSRDARVVVCVGRFVEHKRQTLLMDAMLEVRRRVPEAVLVLVGDGRTREALVAHRDAIGLGDGVVFAGSRTDVPALLELSEVFALTSSYEGIPISVLEAMAAGTPVVASRVPGNTEVVVDERFGLLVPPESPRETAEAILRLLDDPESAHAMAARAQARAKADFDIQASVDRTVEIYDEVLCASAS